MARGTYIYPPRPSMRLITDTFAYCAERLPNWNSISISGYHIREAGSTAVQEIAFTLADGIAYVEAALAAGLEVDAFAPRLSFFWNAHNNLFEEVAKFRAARRMWAKIMTERFGAKDERSKLLRFHTQTGGSTLTAQQPENNIVRVTLQALVGGARAGPRACTPTASTRRSGCPPPTRPRSPCAPSRSSATSPAWPTPSTRWPARTSSSRSPTRSRRRPGDYLERIDAMGGAVAAIEAGFMQGEIEMAAYAYAKAVDDGEKVVVGVNRFIDEAIEPTEVFPIDPALQRAQIERTRRVRAERDQPAVDAALADVAAAARGTQNLLVPMREALRRMATLGEVSDVLRGVFGDLPAALSRRGPLRRRRASRWSRSGPSVAASMAVHAMPSGPVEHGPLGRRPEARGGELGLVVDGPVGVDADQRVDRRAPPARRWPCRSRWWEAASPRSSAR